MRLKRLMTLASSITILATTTFANAEAIGAWDYTETRDLITDNLVRRAVTGMLTDTGGIARISFVCRDGEFMSFLTWPSLVQDLFPDGVADASEVILRADAQPARSFLWSHTSDGFQVSDIPPAQSGLMTLALSLVAAFNPAWRNINATWSARQLAQSLVNASDLTTRTADIQGRNMTVVFDIRGLGAVMARLTGPGGDC